MRVATRSGLARFWILSDIDDTSGDSQWACSALELYRYRRREWQPAVGLLTSCTHADINDASINSQYVCSVLEVADTGNASGSSHGTTLFLDPCRYRRREWQLAVDLLSLGRTCLDLDVDVLIGNCSG